MTTLLAFAFVLGVLVFVHELGHFLAAKRVGIRVLKFQLGFNPTVISFRRGDTEYGIGALPLGGYVKMAGENPEEVERDTQGNIVRRSDEFLSKSKWQRFQVLIMGPTMNILLAVLLTALVLYQGVEKGAYEDQPPVVGAVAEGSPAAGAAVRPGDLIETVNDHAVNTWEQLYVSIGSRANREVSLRVRRDGQPITFKLTPNTIGQGRLEFGDIGVFPNVHPHLASVTPGDPGSRAGLKDGDVILAVDGKPMTFHYQMRELIASHPEKPMTVTILRGGVQQTLTVTPDRHGTVGWLGVRPVDDTTSFKPRAAQAVTMSVQRNIECSAVWRIGTVGLGRPLWSDGVDQPESRAAESDADSSPRRGPHLHHGAGRACPARLQPARQGEGAARRFCPDPDADGDSHLQRSDANRVDRAADALALMLHQLDWRFL